MSFESPARRESETPIRESLPDRTRPDPESALIRSESRSRVRKALLDLGERERSVLTQRFGLEGERSVSLREVGAGLGLSPEAIRLIEKRAARKLRRALDGKAAIRRPPLPGPRDGGRRAPRT